MFWELLGGSGVEKLRSWLGNERWKAYWKFWRTIEIWSQWPWDFSKIFKIFCFCIKSNELRVELVGSRFTMINEGSLISLIWGFCRDLLTKFIGPILMEDVFPLYLQKLEEKDIFHYETFLNFRHLSIIYFILA